MSAEFTKLFFASLFSKRSRTELVNVGRAIRSAHFQSTDDFPCMKLPEIIARLCPTETEPPPVLLPPAALLFGNTIGGLAPYYYIGALCAAKQPKTIFEIGTYLGASALTCALNSPVDSQVITVDLPDQKHTNTLSNGDKALVQTAMSRVGSVFLAHPLSSRITQVRADSTTMNIGDYLQERKIDFFLVDGGHSYECVSRDTEAAFRHLAPDGLILWDDYSWLFPGVCKVLQKTASTRRLIRIEGTPYIVFHPSLA